MVARATSWGTFASGVSLVVFVSSLGVSASASITKNQTDFNASIPEVLENQLIPHANELNGSARAQKIDQELGTLQKEIQKKVTFFYKLQNGTQPPLYVWESKSKIETHREKIIPLVKFEIKNLIKRAEDLQIRREEIAYEMELQRVTEPDSLNKPANIDSSGEFLCSAPPAITLNPSEKIRIEQPFGQNADKETGLSWNTTGWWIRKTDGSVRSCSSGIVAFDGPIQGRGRVVLIDHGQNVMTLYANLKTMDVNQNPLGKGAKVKAGDVLGLAEEKFYFEVRRSGNPIDPALAFAKELKNKIHL